MPSDDYQSCNISINNVLAVFVTLLSIQMLCNTVRDSNGEILTGQIWRQRHGFFKNLPFYSNIPRMEDMSAALLGALGGNRLENPFIDVLLVSGYNFQNKIWHSGTRKLARASIRLTLSTKLLESKTFLKEQRTCFRCGWRPSGPSMQRKYGLLCRSLSCLTGWVQFWERRKSIQVSQCPEKSVHPNTWALVHG